MSAVARGGPLRRRALAGLERLQAAVPLACGVIASATPFAGFALFVPLLPPVQPPRKVL